VLNPPPYRDLAPATLRADYKADYVLMVAEIYHQDGNLPQALRRLTQLDAALPPARIVAEALLSARDLDYAQPDLELLAGLAQVLQSSAPEMALTASPEAEATPTPGSAP
jgi:outer membrane PBP1 activator LpoA protein